MSAHNYLARLREKNEKKHACTELHKPKKGFTQFLQFPDGVQKIDFSEAHDAANDPPRLPDELALAAHFEGQLPPPPEPGYERIPMEAAGYAFEVDVPEQQAPAARASLRFRLHNGDGGSLLGAPGTTEEELREVLVAKYAGRLESIDEQPLP